MPWGESTGSMKIWSILLEDTATSATAWIGPQVICKHIATGRNKKLDITLRGWLQSYILDSPALDRRTQRSKETGGLATSCLGVAELWLIFDSANIVYRDISWPVTSVFEKSECPNTKLTFRRWNLVSILYFFTMEHLSIRLFFFFPEAQDLIENFRKKVKSSDKPVKAKARSLWVRAPWQCWNLVRMPKSGRTTKLLWRCTRKLLRISRSMAPRRDSWGWSSTQPR